MKILVIRGQNLASLAGDFELDLDKGPLSKAGLFAITGAVGAGKSTTLDAMCLALFDRTPRLSARGGALVGRAEDDEKVRVSANDVRGLLRRGTGSGFAEVEFIGVDGRQYRSRWSIRRARNKAGGALQKQEMALLDIAADKQIGGKKTETLELIQNKLGLSFEQFRRSALLAQGEFSSFLKAEPKDRAQLLERMTGTEIYGLLSKAAHERGADEQKRSDELSRDLEQVALLSPEQREVLTQEREALQKQITAWKQREELWRKQNQWLLQQKSLSADLANAAQQLTEQQINSKTLEPRRQSLAEARKAQALRPELQETRRAETAQSDAEKRLAECQQSKTKSESALLACRQQLETAQLAANKATDTRSAAEPELMRARAVDQDIAVQKPQAEAANKALDGVSAELNKTQSQSKVIEEDHQALAQKLEASKSWLKDNATAGPLAQRWDHWRAQFDSLAKVETENRAASIEHSQKEDLSAQSTALVITEKASCLKAREALDTADQEFRRLEGEQPSLDRAELGRQREAATKHRQVCVGLTTDSSRRAELETNLRDRSEDARKAAEQRAVAMRRGGEVQLAQAETESKLSEATQMHQKAMVTAGLAEHRQSLVDGEACPLCGALDHPLAADGAVGSILADLQTRVEEHSAQKGKLDLEAASLRETVKGKGDRLKELDAEILSSKEALESLDKSLLALRGELDGMPSDLGALQAWSASEIDRIDALLTKLQAQETEASEHQARLTTAGKARDKQRDTWQKAQDTLRVAEAQAAERQRDLDQVTQRKTDLQRREAEGFDAFEEVLSDQADWRVAFLADKAAFVQGLDARVVTWRERTAAVESADAKKLELDKAQAVNKSNITSLTESHTKLLVKRDEFDAGLQAILKDRSLCLDGKSVESVTLALDSDLRTAQEGLETARKQDTAAQRLAAELSARCETLLQAATKSKAEHHKASAALTAGLIRLGFELDQLTALLSHDDVWLATEEKALRDAGRMQDDAVVRHQEGEKRLAKHQIGRPKGFEELEPETVISEERLTLDTEKSELDETGNDLRLRLDRDNQARTKQKDLIAAFEKHKATAGVWLNLRDLIGSHDGQKFRTFAQSLTFENLLGYANRFLKDLAPRYRLMRVPGQDLELQAIDLDMGEEVRSIHSLSGGESFLVSLALALGLASMSARRTKVETLFIDEGFGTLDPQSLDIALSALDALQASGHQVGIISHVSGLAERIGVQVRVEKRSGGRSELVIDGLG